MSSILRSGRLAATRKDVVNFISSFHEDLRISRPTVLINEAHVLALRRAKIIRTMEAHKILKALQKIEQKIPHRKGVEDIHILIEEYVTRQAGEDVGGRMHIAKSRNDQAATAIRMTLRGEILEVFNAILSLESALLRLSKRHVKTLFPGYTHLQPAQPITFAHYLLANGDSIIRDAQRLIEAYSRVNLCPMGAGALAGSSFRLDRKFVAHLLGFNGIVENSLDAVGTRDFALDALGAFSLIALDLSRLAQDMIFYSAGDVGLLEIPDDFASTSSIMPQKKNPDPLEVLRARCAHVLGNYTTAAMILFALPSGYNLDFQEITPLIWRSSDTLKFGLKIATQLIPRIKVNPTISNRPGMTFVAATEIANMLVRSEGLPFRSAHRIVGRAVRTAISRKRSLSDFTAEDWYQVSGKKFHTRTIEAIDSALDLRRQVELYRSEGSPNPKEVERMIREQERQVKALTRHGNALNAKLQKSARELSLATRGI